MNYTVFSALICIILAQAFSPVSAQMITGHWKGKIDKKKVELKIIQNGDSLAGTSYYYESDDNYRRYSIKGYFDPSSNSAVWWDVELIEESVGRRILNGPGRVPYLSSADFNCPGSGQMFLEGEATHRDKENDPRGSVQLEKTTSSQFPDEWDFVIDNYTSGANDPYIIDSIALISITPTIIAKNTGPVHQETTISRPENKPINTNVPRDGSNKLIQSPVLAIQEHYIRRERIFTKEIPISGDSIELKFYDNAQIDGDSISLFLNDKLIFQHIRLTASAYSIRLHLNELKDTNELIMVAENLGEIPPNTSYMVAIVGDKRYDAQLSSSENTSAMIRLVKEVPGK